MRKVIHIPSYTFTKQTVRVHNQQHAWTLRESCTICKRLGNVYVDTN